MTILIDTERLQMREFTLADIDAVFEFSSCEQVSQYTGDKGMVQTKTDAKYIIENVWMSEYEKYGYGRYALIHKQDNKVIGFCGVKYIESQGCPDIGYRMLPDYWQQGLGHEAVKATLQYAKQELGLTKIIADVDVNNEASNRLLIRLGFDRVPQHAEGELVNYYQIRL